MGRGGEETSGVFPQVNVRRVVECSYVPGISCLAFNRDGTQLAIACSYTFEQGTAVNGMTNFVCIRSVKPNEVTPKSVSS